MRAVSAAAAMPVQPASGLKSDSGAGRVPPMGDRCASTACPHPSSCVWLAVKALRTNWDGSRKVRWCMNLRLCCLQNVLWVNLPVSA